METSEAAQIKLEIIEDDVQIIQNDQPIGDAANGNAESNNNIDGNQQEDMQTQEEQPQEEEDTEHDYEVDLECEANGIIDVDVNELPETDPNAAANNNSSNTNQANTNDSGQGKSKIIDLKTRPKLSRYEREKIYKLPSTTPHIVVHPSATAKAGKFNCHIATLSTLLDYNKVLFLKTDQFLNYFLFYKLILSKIIKKIV